MYDKIYILWQKNHIADHEGGMIVIFGPNETQRRVIYEKEACWTAGYQK